jgi:hypothetical protein
MNRREVKYKALQAADCHEVQSKTLSQSQMSFGQGVLRAGELLERVVALTDGVSARWLTKVTTIDPYCIKMENRDNERQISE